MNKNFWIVAIALILGSISLNAQQAEKAYSIKGQIKGIADTSIYLANYFGNKLYYNDTTSVDSKGNFKFKDKLRKDGGKYAIVVPGPKFFDLIIGDDDVELQTNVSDMMGNLVYTKSKNNQIFLEYVRFINEKMKMRGPFSDCMEDSTKTEEQKEVCRNAVLELNDEVIEYQNNLADKYPDLLATKIIKMSMEVVIPDEVLDADSDTNKGLDEIEFKRKKYNWYKTHYWDNVDLTDDRLVRDQSFDRVLEKYINTVLPKVPDSMMVEADTFIARVIGKENLFKYVVHKFTYLLESSKVMCMDRAFVHIIDTYYKTGMVDWLEPEKLAEIIEAADDKKATLCGEIAPNIILPDTTGKNWVSLYEVDSPYTLVVIWEPSCGHCKKEMPKIKEIYDNWKDSLTIFAVGNEQENKDWLKFIKEKDLSGWIHISDTPEIMKPDSARTLIYSGITTLESLNFRQTYNIKSTPQIFLLDENKEIIAKQLSSEQVDDFMKHLTGVEEMEDGILEIEEENIGTRE